MYMKRVFSLILAVNILLLALGVEPTRAASPAWKVNPPDQGIVASTDSGSPIGSSFLIADQPIDTARPAVAYNSQRQEYLVVWWNDRAGCDDIYGQRVSKGGALLGPHFSIAAGCPGERSVPDVAYNSQANEYLVVWQLYSTPTYSVLGQRVSATGGLTGGTVHISDGTSILGYYSPAIAYASTENKYLVVFEIYDYTPKLYGIEAQALNSDGSAWGGYFIVGGFWVTNLLSMKPDLAYNQMRNEFLVVWQQDAATLRDIAGRRVKMAGGAATLGADFWIYQDASGDDLNPAVAAVPRPPDGQYLVVWEHYTTSGDVWAQRVAGEGTLEGTAFSVYSSTGYDSSPAVAGNERDQQYLVTWSSELGYPPPNPPFVGIFERFISTAGGSYQSDVVWIAGLFADHPAVASGPLGDNLIAYEDTPGSGQDIWVILLGNRVYLPLVLR